MKQHPEKQLAELRVIAAQTAINYLKQHLNPEHIIGIGTGATVEVFINLLAKEHLKFSCCVASSVRSAIAVQRAGLIQQPLTQCDTVDFYIDGIDEGLTNGICLKGGGGALAREKVLAAMAKIFITIADHQRQVQQLGKFALPVEILPVAQAAVFRKLISIGARLQLRENFITDNGNVIVDVSGLNLSDPAAMEIYLNNIPGIVENGIFAHNRADFMIFSYDKGAEWISINNSDSTNQLNN